MFLFMIMEMNNHLPRFATKVYFGFGRHPCSGFDLAYYIIFEDIINEENNG